MAVTWFASAVQAVHTVLSIVNATGGSMECPPVALVWSGAFTLGGYSINNASGGEAYDQQQLVQDLILDRLKTEQDAQYAVLKLINANAEEARRKMATVQGTNCSQVENEAGSLLRTLEDIIGEQHSKTDTVKGFWKLWKTSVAAMVSQDEKDINSFKEVQTKYPSHELLLDFALEVQDLIVSTMETYANRSRTILEKYEKLFSSMVVQVLAMEGFYCGVAEVENKKMVECQDKFLSNVEEAMHLFYTHVTTFEVHEKHYWPELAKKMLVANMDGTDYYVADAICDELNRIYTTDIFTVSVWTCIDNAQNPEKYCKPVYVYSQGKEQVLNQTTGVRGNWLYEEKMHKNERDKTVVVVHRSLRNLDVPREEYERVRSYFRAAAHSYKYLYDAVASKDVDSHTMGAFALQHAKYLSTTYELQCFVTSGFASYPEVKRTQARPYLLDEDDNHIFPFYHELTWE